MPDRAHKLLLGLLGGSSAAFSPLSIPGLALWLDASDAGTLFQADNGTTPAVADGAAVGYWGDKSGHGNHVTQENVDRKPVLKTDVQNSKNAVLFDASNDMMECAGLTFTKPNTWIVVFRTGAGGTSFLMDGISVRQAVYIDAGSAYLYAGSSPSAGSTPNTTTFIGVFMFNGASSYGRINAVQSSTVDAGALEMSGLRLGNNTSITAGFNGHIMEVIACSGELSVPLITASESYVNAKWAVV